MLQSHHSYQLLGSQNQSFLPGIWFLLLKNGIKNQDFWSILVMQLFSLSFHCCGPGSISRSWPGNQDIPQAVQHSQEPPPPPKKINEQKKETETLAPVYFCSWGVSFYAHSVEGNKNEEMCAYFIICVHQYTQKQFFLLHLDLY